MTAGHAHPHALPGVAHAPAGMPLPAYGSPEVARAAGGWRSHLDVVGGVAFAMFVGLICERVGARLLQGGTGWSAVIAWEAVFLVAAMLCAPLMPSAIRHDISWRSTFEGLALDWPELLYATWVLGMYSVVVGGIILDAGPIAFVLAIGIAEEFFFRVLLLGWLVGRVSAPAALTISSFVFGAAHMDSLSLAELGNCAPQIAGGFVLGAVYLRTRNPIGPILAHAYWDFPYFMVIGVSLQGSTSLLPWLGLTVYGLWLIRHGVPLTGRVVPVENSVAAPAREGQSGYPAM